MTKVTIEVDYEETVAVLNMAASVPGILPETVTELLSLREKLFEAMDTAYPKVAWKEFRAGYRDLEWIQSFRRGYVKEEVFNGLEIDMLGNVRFADGRTLMTDVEMPKTEWYHGDPEAPVGDRLPNEQYPTGRLKFEYGGRTWFFILRKHGPLNFPVIWIVDESFWDEMPIRLFEANL